MLVLSMQGEFVTQLGCVALTGFDTFWGVELAQRLRRRQGPLRVVGIDLECPLRGSDGIDFFHLDLMDEFAEEALAEILLKTGAEAVVHLGYRTSPTRFPEADRSLNVEGTAKVLGAVQEAGVSKLVVASSTMLYGARPDNPNFLIESQPLRGNRESSYLKGRIDAEEQVRTFASHALGTEVTVLRSAWAMGPRYTDEITAFFSREFVPTCLGYDPLLQFVAEDDLLAVYEAAVCESHPGVFNVVAQGVLPLSTLLALAGRKRCPLPTPLFDRWPRLSAWTDSPDPTSSFYDYLRYLWVADGEHGWAEFGELRYTTREAWISFVSAAHVERYR